MQIQGLNIHTTTDALSTITGKEDADEVFFDTDTVPLRNGDGTENGWYEHINVTTEKTISINKNGNLRPYSESLNLMLGAVAQTNLDKYDVTAEFFTSNNGGRLFASVKFNNEIIAVNNTTAAFQLLLWDSYDQSNALIIKAGSYVAVCANKQIVGDTISGVHSKHTKNFDYELAFDGVTRAINEWNTEKKKYEEWVSIPISEIVASRAIDEFTNSISQRDRIFTQFRE